MQQEQELQPADLLKHLAFTQWLLTQKEGDPNFISRILSMDKACLTRHGIVI
jgi:hypothetical protein